MKKLYTLNLKLIFILAIIVGVTTTTNVFAANDNLSLQQQWQKKQATKKKGRVDQQELRQISERLADAPQMKSTQRQTQTVSPALQTLFNSGQTNSIALNRTSMSLRNSKIVYSETNGTPVSITKSINSKQNSSTNHLEKITPASATDAAYTIFETNRDVFRIDSPRNELHVSSVTTDKFGKSHIVFKQYYQGVPVWGKDLVVHLAPQGDMYAFNARYAPTPNQLKPKDLRVSQQQAIEIATTDLSRTTDIVQFSEFNKKFLKYNGPVATQYIRISPDTQQPRLIWHVQIRPNFRDNWFYFVDAITGDILEQYNATNFDGASTGSGIDLQGIPRTLNVFEQDGAFYMIDSSRPIWQPTQPDVLNDPKGALWTLDVRGNDLSNQVQIFQVSSPNNTWSDPTAVSAHYNVGEVFAYYHDVHGRQAIDGSGSTIISIVHVTDEGQPMDNAFWNGVAMAYGDGDFAFESLAAALDVAAHEMTHGVIQSTVNLEYKFQAGALNESLADVFGVMVDNDDWTIGEEVTKTSYITTGALRNMQDPHNGGSFAGQAGWQPANMNEFVQLDISQDNGGVHINSGIPNHACYLIANAIGREKTAQIYYRVLDARYLNSQSNFVDMRLAAIRAAGELYGESSTEVDAVKAAFDGVGITGDTGSTPPPDLPAVKGEEWIATIKAEVGDNSLYLVRPIIQTNEDIVQLTPTQLSTTSGKPISVSDDGTVLLFIDSDNFIRYIESTGFNEQVVSDMGVWKSLALSPDATRLAATSVYEDSTIYIFDLENSANSKAINLYGATTQEDVKSNTTVYADVLDWDLSGTVLIYDAFNRIPQSSGAAIEYWDINLLDVDNEIILPLFPPQPEGISVGNPAFARSNSNFFVFDYIDYNAGTDEIWGVDLFTGNTNLIEDNGASIGYPRYSPNDKNLVFQKMGSTKPSLYQIALANNKIQPAGSAQAYVDGGMLPTWFAIGQRQPTDIPAENTTTARRFDLKQNYPNPFNPETSISYQLSQSANINLIVYEVQGREVVRLDYGSRQAGDHTITWNGRDLHGNLVSSGIYLYRLQVMPANGKAESMTRKLTLLK
ncbi:M4 family metallopeptidase [candidate division KSB1 bacterium]|nr:M4 family metallopeptidase [candidate division KSB1 bacterium]